VNAQIQPLAELNQRATDALVREVGIVDAIRFLNQFRTGGGNYTMEREQLFQGMSVKDIADELKSRK
jgi:hypothetical protein